jgi:hypothetical protein
LSTKPNPVFQALLNQPAQYLGRSARWVWTLQARERIRLSQEMRAMSGLMPLLMKQRNGYRWSREDKRKIKEQLRHLVHLGPYLTLAVMPGGFFVLPVLAWWLDRRRQKRIDLGHE